MLSAQCRYPQLSYFETLGGLKQLSVWIERTKPGGEACLNLPFRCLFSCPLAGCVDCHHREHSHPSLPRLVLQLRTPLPRGMLAHLGFPLLQTCQPHSTLSMGQVSCPLLTHESSVGTRRKLSGTNQNCPQPG